MLQRYGLVLHVKEDSKWHRWSAEQFYETSKRKGRAAIIYNIPLGLYLKLTKWHLASTVTDPEGIRK